MVLQPASRLLRFVENRGALKVTYTEEAVADIVEAVNDQARRPIAR